MVQVVFRQRSPTTRRLSSPRNNTIASGTMTSQTKALWISIGVLLAIILSIVSPHHRTSRSNNNAVLPEHWSIQPPFSSNLPSPAAIVSTTHPPVIRTHKGLLIVFIHIPKTGGSSIREGLRSQADLFLWGLGDSNCRRHIDTLYTHVQNWTDGNTVFLEWHTQDCPSYASMRDHFVTIRKQAQQNNIPVFFFSIVREPFAHAVSWYTYYMMYVQVYETKQFSSLFYLSISRAFVLMSFSEWKRQRLSAQGFRRELISNPQSLFLARSEVAYKQ